VRNPWEVLRNPDLRLNAHYYITKVTGLETDVVSLVFTDKYVPSKLNLCIGFILKNGDGRLVGGLYCTMVYRRVADPDPYPDPHGSALI
jgi:hypothetical protein